MEFDNTIPIYVQVIQQIKREMIRGELPPGEKMPSARDLALRYQINPNTANRIYKELEAEQLVFTKRGLGTYVTEDRAVLIQIREEITAKQLQEFVAQMKELGFSKEELLEHVAKEYER
ncbi:MAG: GntR family transcriptional regulator [Lachnospiraceae bacterium]|nr:GntR family transcriptional regulator [Lachnospiraceae bacterium]